MAEILVVDDNSAVRMAYRMLLTTAGHTVTEADGGAAAIAVLAQRGFDLVVTDLWMPEVDGFAVIAEVRRCRPELRVLAITGTVLGTGADDPTERARRLGANAVIEKPMLGEGLLETVAAMLA